MLSSVEEFFIFSFEALPQISQRCFLNIKEKLLSLKLIAK